MRRTLAERKQAHDLRKARLAADDAQIALAERKLRTRKLIEAGGLVDKAGLLALEPAALYGALLSLSEAAGRPDSVAQWAAQGGRAFAREAKTHGEGCEAVVVTFAKPVPKDVGTTLRKAGFRFSRVLQHWEGIAHYDDAVLIARDHGGHARRVAVNTPGAAR